MTENGLLEYIFARLGSTGAVIFSADEVEDWPSGALDAFIKNGLLRRAQPAQVIECTGCEENCFMPVHVSPAEGKQLARAFIACDKRDDIGRVLVEMRRLDRWQITGDMLAEKFATLIGFDQTPQADSTGKRWALGILKGAAHKAQVALAIDDGVSLKLAGHDVPLMEVLALNKGKLTADKNELLNLVDKPAKPSGASEYKPTVARREARKLDTQAMYESWRKEYRALKKKHQNKSEVWYSQQIAKLDIAKGRDAGTIKKHMQS